MSPGRADLARRRRELTERSARQREELAGRVEAFRQAAAFPLRLADSALSVIRSLRCHPFLAAGAFGLAAALLPGSFRRWIRRGWDAARFLRRVRKGFFSV